MFITWNGLNKLHNLFILCFFVCYKWDAEMPTSKKRKTLLNVFQRFRRCHLRIHISLFCFLKVTNRPNWLNLLILAKNCFLFPELKPFKSVSPCYDLTLDLIWMRFGILKVWNSTVTVRLSGFFSLLQSAIVLKFKYQLCGSMQSDAVISQSLRALFTAKMRTVYTVTMRVAVVMLNPCRS